MTGPPLRWASFLAPNMAPVHQFVAGFVSRRLGYAATFSAGRSVAEFESRAVDIGFICGLPYVELAGRVPVPVEVLCAPVLSGERYGDRPIYFSDVIVSANSLISHWEDLRGRSWSYNEPHSQSGYNVVCHRLVELNEGARFFGGIVAAGWHQRSINMVASGEVEASAIDSQVLEIELRERPHLRDLIKIIDVLGPSTIQPVVASTRIDEKLRDDVKQIFFEMGRDADARAVLAHGFVSRWQAMDDSDYDDIRRMLAAVKAAGVSLVG
jgi:ABC-type phosphate/phosphonate transport system substrate-binding protein